MSSTDTAALSWRKSLASYATNCVLVASRDKCVLARDSADAQSITLVFSAHAWAAFLDRVRQDKIKTAD